VIRTHRALLATAALTVTGIAAATTVLTLPADTAQVRAVVPRKSALPDIPSGTIPVDPPTTTTTAPPPTTTTTQPPPPPTTTTEAPVTTTTQAPAPQVVQGGSDATSTNTADWECIRYHESTDRYNDSSAPSGAYGILESTWTQTLGMSGEPYQADPGTQDQEALILYNRFGWQPWSTAPGCGL
jgi:hypothetical protein